MQVQFLPDLPNTMKTLEQALADLKIPFELAPTQAEDIRTLAPFGRVGLFHDVGAGKTVMATLIAEMQECETNLITTWPILIDQWVKWLKLVDPENTTTAYYGPKRKASDLDAKWVVTSHAIFRRDYSKLQLHYLKKTHTTTVDEAQGLKDVGSKLYRLTKAISQGQPLILATGTPTSKPSDAYSYISLKTPGKYRSMEHFENLHVVERDIFGAVQEWRGLEQVSENLMLQAVKRTKEEMFAGMLHPPVYQTLNYDLEPQHKKLYDQLVDEALIELAESGQKIDATTPQRLYHLSQQMVLNWAHFAQNPELRARGLDFIDATVEDAQVLRPERSKLIIWTYHQLSSGRVFQYVRDTWDKHAVAAYGGSDSKKAVHAFMNNPECRIMVAQPMSVGAGLNAMSVCWEMLFLEFSTVSMHIRQSIGRVDRVGQQHIPNIRFAVANGTIQNHLLHNLFKNDDRVSVVERNPQTLRQALMGG